MEAEHIFLKSNGFHFCNFLYGSINPHSKPLNRIIYLDDYLQTADKSLFDVYFQLMLKLIRNKLSIKYKSFFFWNRELTQSLSSKTLFHSVWVEVSWPYSQMGKSFPLLHCVIQYCHNL